jgi:hypothetical protein
VPKALDRTLQSRFVSTTVARSHPVDFYVWGYVQAMVYAVDVNSAEDLFQRFNGTIRRPLYTYL